jgi:hypothetical protein
MPEAHRRYRVTVLTVSNNEAKLKQSGEAQKAD